MPGYVAILTVELHFPEAGSLKGKRKHVLSAKAQLQNRFGASVAEVDHHELWQRCGLTAAFVAREAARPRSSPGGPSSGSRAGLGARPRRADARLPRRLSGQSRKSAQN